MMGTTHVQIGLITGFGVGLLAHTTFPEASLLALVGGVAALLPDIDHPRGKIRQKLGIAGHLGLFWLSHRGLTHTALFALLVGILAFVFAPPLVAFAIVGGYASHLMGDAITRRGIPLWWPVSKRPYHALPRWMRIATGSRMEWVIWLLNLVVIGVLIFGGRYAL